MTKLDDLQRLYDIIPALQAEYDRCNASGNELPMSDFFAAEGELVAAKQCLRNAFVENGPALLALARAAKEFDDARRELAASGESPFAESRTKFDRVCIAQNALRAALLPLTTDETHGETEKK